MCQQKYLEKVGIKTARKIAKTELEMWGVDNNFGREKDYWCGEGESREHVLEFKKGQGSY